MSDTSAIDAASKRLANAMDALEAAVERRCDADHGHVALAEQLHAHGTDRSQLAAELDNARSRVRALESANREATRRVDVAIEQVRTVLQANDR